MKLPEDLDRQTVLLDDLLAKTSRTFALTIPLLPEPTRREVTVAYLLFRIADTFEDASVLWSRPQRIAALEAFCEQLVSPDPKRVAQVAKAMPLLPPTDHAGYLELLRQSPMVLEAFAALSPQAREIVRDHTLRTARGMASVVERAGEDGVLELETLDDVREYCYIVAGIVGEMLTELFLLDRQELTSVAPFLRQRAVAFGEALQLVNILKDSATDVSEGREFLPDRVDQKELFALARRDLETAGEYCLAIQRAGGAPGIVAFTALPTELAWATLERTERRGPGAKLTRPEVGIIGRRVAEAVEAGRPPITGRGFG